MHNGHLVNDQLWNSSQRQHRDRQDKGLPYRSLPARCSTKMLKYSVSIVLIVGSSCGGASTRGGASRRCTHFSAINCKVGRQKSERKTSDPKRSRPGGRDVPRACTARNEIAPKTHCRKSVCTRRPALRPRGSFRPSARSISGADRIGPSTRNRLYPQGIIPPKNNPPASDPVWTGGAHEHQRSAHRAIAFRTATGSGNEG